MKKAKGIKPIEHYLESHYPITVYHAPEGGYVAEVEDLPGCITEGETLEEVFQRIEDARRIWIEVEFEEGNSIPLPRNERKCSGKFIVRIARSLHQRLAEQAEQEGISLNQYVESILAARSATQDMADRIIHQVSNRKGLEFRKLLWTSPFLSSEIYAYASLPEFDIPEKRTLPRISTKTERIAIA